MRISDRFVDYGITGAFFLIGQYILLVIWGQIGWFNNLNDFEKTAISSLPASASSLLTVLGIIGIFVSGLILDLSSQFFAPWFSNREVAKFKEHMRQDQGWLENIAEQYDGYFPEAIDKLTASYSSYLRFRSFLFSFIAVCSKASQLDNLSDELHLWRTSRAIFVATVIWAMEPVLVLVFQLFFYWSKFSFSYDLLFVGSWFIVILFVWITMRLALAAYTRLCHTLFSLAYLTTLRERDDDSNNQQNSHQVGGVTQAVPPLNSNP
jgi:hypothetical protein